MISIKYILLGLMIRSIKSETDELIPVNMGFVMEKTKVVPDVIDTPPTKNIEILYPSGVQVKAGNELTPKSVNERPLVYWKADEDRHYLLIYIDPDSPSRDNPKFESVLHWSVVNIPGNHVELGETLCDYVGALAPPNGGLHRNIFLIFQQEGRILFTEPHILYTNYGERKQFSLSKFMRKYNLKDPIAGNIFFAKFDDYVPIIKQQFEE